MVYNLFSIVRNQSTSLTENCSLCGLSAEGTGFCNPCLTSVLRDGHFCNRCGQALAEEPMYPVCGQCVKKPPLHQQLIAATHYEFPVNHAISEMKFEKQLHHIRSFSHLLAQEVSSHYQRQPLPEAVVPIPLHPRRLRERGFNQSLLIAKHLSRQLEVKVIGDSLLRVKDTPHQIGLKARERRRNLKRAFKVAAELPTHIALVDDVVTTGSTIHEATKECLKQGVERVDVWCLAKT